MKPSQMVGVSVKGYILDAKTRGVRPATTARSSRDSLRVSHGTPPESLRTALEIVLDGCGAASNMEGIQYLTKMALELSQSCPILTQCLSDYELSAGQGEECDLFQAVRDAGVQYTPGKKADKAVALWAFDEPTANAFDSMAGKLGMYTNYLVQIFMCGVLKDEVTLLETTRKKLEYDYRRGLTAIALYDHTLKFDVNSVVM